MFNPMSAKIIDLSHPLTRDTPPFPGDPPVEIDILDSTDRTRDGEHHCNSSRFRMCIHCGTHLDAPFHFFGSGLTIDRIRLEACVGPALLIDLSQRAAETIEKEDLQSFADQIRMTKRIIFKTGWDREWPSPKYFASHPVFSGDAARYLVEAGALLVGVDFPSVDRAPYPAHLEFLGNEVLILENLTNLDAIDSDEFWLCATPLRISGRDGSPVRAVAVV